MATKEIIVSVPIYRVDTRPCRAWLKPSVLNGTQLHIQFEDEDTIGYSCWFHPSESAEHYLKVNFPNYTIWED